MSVSDSPILSRRRPGSGLRRHRAPVAFLAPFGILFLAMSVAPILYAIYRSLFVVRHSGLGLSAPTLVFDPSANYLQVFSDTSFLTSLGRVALFGVVQVPVMLCLALALALLIDATVPWLKSIFRVTSFVPFAIPGVIAAVMWSFQYSPVSSPLNHLLQQTLGFQIPFMSDGLALWSVANVVTWGWTGYNMLIIYAALQSIPDESLEAAKLDGAGPWRTAWSVKIPMVRSALILTAVFSIIGSAQLYNEPEVLQAISGGSISSTFTPIMAAQASVAAQNYPYAAAQSVVLAVIVGALSFAFFRATKGASE